MMPFTFVFTDKQLSIIEEALDWMIVRGAGAPFSVYDIAELQGQIEKRLEW